MWPCGALVVPLLWDFRKWKGCSTFEVSGSRQSCWPLLCTSTCQLPTGCIIFLVVLGCVKNNPRRHWSWNAFYRRFGTSGRVSTIMDNDIMPGQCSCETWQITSMLGNYLKRYAWFAIAYPNIMSDQSLKLLLRSSPESYLPDLLKQYSIPERFSYYFLRCHSRPIFGRAHNSPRNLPETFSGRSSNLVLLYRWRVGNSKGFRNGCRTFSRQPSWWFLDDVVGKCDPVVQV